MMISPNKSKMADDGHIEFNKMLISPYWMRIFAQKMQYDHVEMPTRLKAEPEVISHHVISRMLGTNHRGNGPKISVSWGLTPKT